MQFEFVLMLYCKKINKSYIKVDFKPALVFKLEQIFDCPNITNTLLGLGAVLLELGIVLCSYDNLGAV